MVATEGVLTTTVDVALWPFAVAVMVATPGAMAVTLPALIVATRESFELHTMATPGIAVPLASSAVAVSVPLWPAASCSVGGVSVTDATLGAGFVTVIAAEARTPPLDAVTVAVPAAMAVTTPALLTVAMRESDELQTTVRLVTIAPLVSRTVTVSVAD
jgi:hypothetical protein